MTETSCLTNSLIKNDDERITDLIKFVFHFILLFFYSFIPNEIEFEHV